MNAALLRSFSPPHSPLRMMLSPICRLCGGTEQSQRMGEESGIRGQREEKQNQAGEEKKGEWGWGSQMHHSNTSCVNTKNFSCGFCSCGVKRFKFSLQVAEKIEESGKTFTSCTRIACCKLHIKSVCSSEKNEAAYCVP